MPARPQKVLRRDAVMAGWTDDEAVARQLLTSETPEVRASALGALDRMGCLDDSDLSRALADSRSVVRRRALTILATRWTPELAELIDLTVPLSDDDDVVVELACFVAGECLPPQPATVQRLIEISSGHREVLCRESAVAALGSLGDPISAPAVVAACSDKATVRRRAVLALVAFDGPEVDETLRRLAGDPDWQVRQAAEELLAID